MTFKPHTQNLNYYPLKAFIRATILYLLLLVSLWASAQNTSSDYSENCYDSALYYCNEALFLYDVDTDTAKILAKKGLKLGRSCEIPMLEAFALNILGSINYINCNFKVAETYHRQAIALMLDKNNATDTVELANAYNGLANVFSDIGALESSIDYYLKSLKLQESLNDSLEIGLSYLNIGLVLYDQNNLRASKSSIVNALNHVQNKNAPYLKGDIHGTLSSLYIDFNRLDSAQYFLEQSYNAFNQPGTIPFDGLSKAYYLLTKGRYEAAYERKENALLFFDSAYAIAQNISDDYTLSLIDYYKAEFYFGHNQINKALNHARIALNLAEESQLAIRKVEAMMLLAKIQASLGLYKEAWQLEKQALDLKLDMSSYDIEKKLLTEEINNQLQIKADLLQQNNAIKEKNIDQQKAIELRNKYVMVVLIGIGLLLVYAIFIYRNFQQRNRLIHAKNRIISVLGHDIKAPINQVETITQLALNQDISKEDYKQMLQSVLQSIRALNSTIEVIITWSKGLIEKDNLRLEKVSLQAVLNQSIAFNKDLAEAKEITLNLGITDFKVFGVSEHLELIFRNLINNSVKFSDPKSLIQVATHKEKNHVRVDVVDNGRGLSDDQIKSIMHQKIQKIRSVNSGSGIGLILIQDFLEMNNAHLEIHSQKGKGSIFSVFLSLTLKR